MAFQEMPAGRRRGDDGAAPAKEHNMSRTLMRMALRRSPNQIRYVRPVPRGAARGLVAQVYQQSERDFGLLAPPTILHSPAPEVLAACWLMLRETLVASGSASRAVKEAVAAAVSAANDCPYCVEVHAAMLQGLAHGSDAAAIVAGRLDAVTDPGIAAVARWATASARWDPATAPPPVPAAQAPEVIGVAVTFQYLNRMVHLFLSDSPLPPNVPGPARAQAGRMLGWFMAGPARGHIEPGASLSLLPDAALPADLTWAAANPGIGGAFARAAAAIDAAGRRSVPGPVRELVLTTLARWHGEPPGLSRSWADKAVRGLPGAQQAAGRLALLTALSSGQVVAADIAAVQAAQPGDTALIELTAWASLATARQIGSWTYGPDKAAAAER
jgi:AhpD family alkylhydroperoxidase